MPMKSEKKIHVVTRVQDVSNGLFGKGTHLVTRQPCNRKDKGDNNKDVLCCTRLVEEQSGSWLSHCESHRMSSVC